MKAAAAALLLLTGVAHAAPAGIDVRVAERVEVVQGQTAPLEIAIAVDRGLVVSRDASVILDLAPAEGLHLKKKRLGRADAVDPGADAPRYAVPIRGDTAGEHVVKVRIRLWVCGGRVCKPVDVRKQALVTVSAPAAPAAPPATP